MEIQIGADPNPADHIGFPPLIAALSCSRSQPGNPGRPDVVDIMKLLLVEGTYPAIATHDPVLVAATRAFATDRRIPASNYEFQMLYGIRRDLQAQLVADGYRVRVYVPFGREWFPYFMRRLGERPANVGFVLRGVLAERG